jgi:hypothetical protein
MIFLNTLIDADMENYVAAFCLRRRAANPSSPKPTSIMA